ncbi:hypothetical protein LTR09_009718 [Extremus antarcticus]|uniref:Uncharacterized protein n=1 Tax=Extremus antarcticus TaxID=702011 RepID=A0AAJ0D8K0_9PEZI|nr:hypothetical protein LTR09_009718 [Extremus antarcticus]
MFPPAPRIETPVLGPAVNEFDFGLASTFTPITPCGPAVESKPQAHHFQDARLGAEQTTREQPSLTTTPPQPKAKFDAKSTYKLFPVVKEITGAGDDPQTPPAHGHITVSPQIHPAYRPRKESMSGSIRSRKDSGTSFSGTRRIPMRIISGSTAPSKGRSSTSNSPSNGSTPWQSRWSDETITSPLVATTPGPRTSFGSLLRTSNSQYPACFFEDDEDDESAPLRRKLRWKRSGNATEIRTAKAGRFDDRNSFGRKVKRLLLCGCGT